MAKTRTSREPQSAKTIEANSEPVINVEDAQQLASNKAMIAMLAMNATTMRREIIDKLLSPQKDIDLECGYPTSVSTEQYRTMFDRLGLASRVVQIMPEECWANDPEVYETEKKDETEFESAWAELTDTMPIFHYLLRADCLSGIGRFGVILIGVNDGSADLSTAVEGVEGFSLQKSPKKSGSSKAQSRTLLFLRTLDESAVSIVQYEKDIRNSRFGYPTMYRIKLESEPGSSVFEEKEVHWTRIIHIADNCETSEVFGVPRLQNVYNHLVDVKKVGGGSGEMFWRGGFPGYSFELTPDAANAGAEIDIASVREQMFLYTQGLQRWFSLTGVTTKSLSPQVADPTGHVEMFVKLIGMAKGIPWRLLLGTEEAKLASSQDKTTWNTRVARRQNKYITPKIIIPFVERLIAMGILPRPDELHVEWPDLNAPSREDISKVGQMITEAMAKYVAGNVDNLIPPPEFLTMVLGFTEDEAKAIEKALTKYMATREEEEEEADGPTGNNPDDPNNNGTQPNSDNPADSGNQNNGGQSNG